MPETLKLQKKKTVYNESYEQLFWGKEYIFLLFILPAVLQIEASLPHMLILCRLRIYGRTLLL